MENELLDRTAYCFLPSAYCLLASYPGRLWRSVIHPDLRSDCVKFAVVPLFFRRIENPGLTLPQLLRPESARNSESPNPFSFGIDAAGARLFDPIRYIERGSAAASTERTRAGALAET